MKPTLAPGLSALLLAACQPAADAPPETAPAAASAPESVPPAPVAPADSALARLSGRVAYPSEYLPPMRVCALAADDPGIAHCTLTEENQPHYGLSLPPGTWWLLAWPQDTGTAGDPGLVSAASDCLGAGGTDCVDHAPLPVTVAAGEHREGLDINDWYYDPREFPPPMAPAEAPPATD